jgi:hypothetical protein
VALPRGTIGVVIYRRGVVPVLLLLALVVVGAVVRFVDGAGATGQPSAAAPSATPSATTRLAARGVGQTLASVERAFNAGDARLLCRPGRLVDPAVLRKLGPGCESQVEALMGDEPPLRLTLRGVLLEPDLATATVTTARKTIVTVDLVRQGRRWLLSFSDGDAPMPELAGART